MKEIAALILAAGKGTRMKSDLVKVLHPLMGMPMLWYPIETVKKIGSRNIVVVVGYQAGRVRNTFDGEDIIFVEQKEQLGTGHAVLCAEQRLGNFRGDVLILCGDVPLIKEETVRKLVAVHQRKKSKVTVLTTILENPEGYGRIIKGENGDVLRIVEEKDASRAEREVQEVNTGIYCVDGPYLFRTLDKVGRVNEQSEYYLTDIVAIAAEDRESVVGFLAEDPSEVMGINNRRQMAKAIHVIRERIIDRLMLNGVTVIDPRTTFIERDVRIGRDTVICPGCYIRGASTIGQNCIVEQGSIVINSELGDGVVIKSYSVISDSKICGEASIGPFAHLRPGTELGSKVKIGNFVEVKKSKIGEGSKASHLSYLGDAVVGRGVNVGAGTITCNYDGKRKYETVIEDGVFIGSDTQFVAPVTIGECAYIGAGSTITRDVPSGSLALSRSRQVIKERREDKE